MGRLPHVMSGSYLVFRFFDVQVAAFWRAIWRHEVPLRAISRRSRATRGATDLRSYRTVAV